MAFTKDDLASMLRLLEEEPDLRRAFADRLLSESQRAVEASVQELAATQQTTGGHLDSLAARVDGLAEQMVALASRVDALTERVDDLAKQMVTLTARIDALTERVDALTERVDALTQRIDALTEALQALITRTDKLTDWVGELRGDAYERRYREQASTRFAPIARRVRLLTGPPLDDLLDDAVDAGTLTEDEAHEVRLADAVVRGRRRDDGAELLLVAEISAGVGVRDVQRAADRARILKTLGRPVLAVVAGGWVNAEAAEAAAQLGVWQISDQGAQPPPAAPSAAAS